MMGGLWQDVKYGVRTLAKNPGFTATAVITLALAIGANTAVFSVVDPLLLRKLPVERPDELVLVHAAGSVAAGTISESEDSAFAIYRDQNSVFTGMFASADFPKFDFERNGETYPVDGQLVTGSYFPVLGVRPFRGRLIAPNDDVAPSGSPVVVLSFEFWRRVYASDAGAIGQIIPIRGQAFTIIGVTPPEFFGMTVGASPDVFLPMGASAVLGKQTIPGLARWVTVFGRLKLGISLDQAKERLEPLFEEAKRVSTVPPIELQQDMARLVLAPASRGLDELREKYSLSGRVLMAAVVFVLLIACANVTNLVLARGMERRRELTVRRALGAGRGRLLQQLLAESSLLTLAGGGLGLLFAVWTSQALVGALSTRRLPLVLNVGIDARVMGFAILVVAAATLLMGIAPAIFSARADLSQELKVQAGRSATARSSRLSKSMMTAQIAMSVTLLVATGLLVRSLVNLETTNVGFDRNNVLLVSFGMKPGNHPPEQMKVFYDDLLSRVKRLPGVRSANLTHTTPINDSGVGINVAVEGDVPRASTETHVFFTAVTPGYFGTIGIPLLSGRDFTERDASFSAAIINRRMAQHYFGNQDPIGRRFRFVEGKRPPIEIVGVVENSKYNDIREETPDFLYVPMGPHATVTTTLIVRANTSFRLLITPVQTLMNSLSASISITNVSTMREQIDESLHQDRLVAALSGGFSLLALALTAVGLFGVLSFSVARRTSEIGVRMALGARPADIFQLIVGNGMTLVVIGLVIGAGGAAAAGRLLRGMLFGVKGFDPVAMASVVVVLGAAAFLACSLPARRASRVDPMRALRSE